MQRSYKRITSLESLSSINKQKTVVNMMDPSTPTLPRLPPHAAQPFHLRASCRSWLLLRGPQLRGALRLRQPGGGRLLRVQGWLPPAAGRQRLLRRWGVPLTPLSPSLLLPARLSGLKGEFWGNGKRFVFLFFFFFKLLFGCHGDLFQNKSTIYNGYGAERGLVHFKLKERPCITRSTKGLED